MLEWWQELQANSEAVDRALARQQQAAADVGPPWPPVRHPAAERSPNPELYVRTAGESQAKA